MIVAACHVEVINGRASILVAFCLNDTSRYPLTDDTTQWRLVGGEGMIQHRVRPLPFLSRRGAPLRLSIIINNSKDIEHCWPRLCSIPYENDLSFHKIKTPTEKKCSNFETKLYNIGFEFKFIYFIDKKRCFIFEHLLFESEKEC